MGHIPFTHPPLEVRQAGPAKVYVFPTGVQDDAELLASFGAEWRKFNCMDAADLATAGGELFDLWPKDANVKDLCLLDVGCGNGRWTRYLAEHVGQVDAVDPSLAVEHAAARHHDLPHVRWSMASAEELPFPNNSYQRALCIGVLHHLKDPGKALDELRRVLIPGGVLYFYVYYALEQRGMPYRTLYRFSDLLRRSIHRLPGPLKRAVCEAIAVLAYAPLVALARAMKALGMKLWRKMPLAYYHNKSFHVMRNDALDRFGTPVEQRYTKQGIQELLEASGFGSVQFSDGPPFWHGVAVAL